MKSRDVGVTVTSNDEHVRLRIFDGVIPADKYWQEMYEAERGQHDATRQRLHRLRERLRATPAEVK